MVITEASPKETTGAFVQRSQRAVIAVLILNNDVEFGPQLFRSMQDSMTASGAHALAPCIRYHDRPK